VTWLILGCGYLGAHLTRALLRDGETVRVCARDPARLAPLAPLGAEVCALDLSGPGGLEQAFAGLDAPVVVHSVPPAGDLVERAVAAARSASARRFVYLSSTGVYGDTPPGVLVDEATPTAADAESAPRLADEAAVAASGLDTVILRLAAIYGPGRGLRARLRRGDYLLTDGGAGTFSRIHVDDLVAIVRAAVARAPSRALYCVADDRPSTQREYVEWLCAHLGLPLPSSAPPDPSKPRHASRGRRVANAKLKRELGYELLRPTFVEGERAIDETEG
jgi:nucleoside-diphosphate-sugar epimerase